MGQGTLSDMLKGMCFIISGGAFSLGHTLRLCTHALGHPKGLRNHIGCSEMQGSLYCVTFTST